MTVVVIANPVPIFFIDELAHDHKPLARSDKTARATARHIRPNDIPKPHRRYQPLMTTIILQDEVAALEAELDLLRAQLAKARHHKKPYEGMTTEEYRAALDKLGLSIVGSAEYLGLSRRQSQRYANGTSPVADPVAKLLRLAIRTGLTANDLKAI